MEVEEKATAIKEFDLRPPEALQRDYQRVLRAQASADAAEAWAWARAWA